MSHCSDSNSPNKYEQETELLRSYARRPNMQQETNTQQAMRVATPGSRGSLVLQVNPPLHSPMQQPLA